MRQRGSTIMRRRSLTAACLRTSRDVQNHPVDAGHALTSQGTGARPRGDRGCPLEGRCEDRCSDQRTRCERAVAHRHVVAAATSTRRLLVSSPLHSRQQLLHQVRCAIRRRAMRRHPQRVHAQTKTRMIRRRTDGGLGSPSGSEKRGVEDLHDLVVYRQPIYCRPIYRQPMYQTIYRRWRSGGHVDGSTLDPSNQSVPVRGDGG